MSLPPLPALKPDGEGGYTVCPKCAAFWLTVLFVAALGYYLYRRKQA